MSRRHTITLTLFLTMAACGRPAVPYSPGTSDDGGPGDSARAAPVLTSYSPGSLAVGETLNLRGKGFTTTKGARITLWFKGRYEDSQGKSTAVDFKRTAKALSSSRLTWRLWPDIVFHPTGARLGRFFGKVVATNHHGDSKTSLDSNALAVTLLINPSLILRQSQPKSTNCQAVVANTLEGEQWTFTVEAVGLRKATKDHPLTFIWGLRAEQWDVQLKHTSLYRKPPPKHGLIVLEDRRGSGRTSTLSAGVSNYLVKDGSDLLGNLQVKSLATGAISSSYSNLPVTVYVVAVDSSSKTIRLSIDLTVRFPGEVSYAGKVKLVSQGKPKSLTECIPGPREVVTYAHGSASSKKRTLTVKYREVCKRLIFPRPAWTCSLDSLKTNNILIAFGLSGWQYSPKPKHNLSGSIPKGHYGMFYRQLIEFHRVGLLTLWDRCGRSVVGADVILTDWAYAAELATGPTCPPPSKLPPAKKW